MSSSIGVVAYVALFAGIGFAFVFANLFIGHFLRPADPHEEKQEIYECGEPTIGSSFVQFDLRFYVVALVFIIFDVEVAFLFPWATAFGKATNLMNDRIEVVQTTGGEVGLTPAAAGLYRELGVRNPSVTSSDPAGAAAEIVAGARRLARLCLLACSFFFVVLLIGFAYEWKTGALDWVRAIRREHSVVGSGLPTTSARQESVLSA